MTVRILHGDCTERLLEIDADTFHACVTDPPYHLTSIVKRFAKTPRNEKTVGKHAYGRHAAGFMGKTWDGGDVAFQPETWAEVLRVLRPGAFMVAFASTRGYHRMTCAIEDAGFIIHPMIGWLFGCLDEQTELVSESGVKPYDKAIVGERVLCYDKDTGAYSYQPILEIVEYDYDDTAYRLIGDFGEQVVSRNHRCIVERGGKEVFVFAEEAALECEARVPVLESLPDLQRALSSQRPEASDRSQNVQSDLFCESDWSIPERQVAASSTSEGRFSPVRSLSEADMETGRVDTQGSSARMFSAVQRRDERGGVGQTCSQRPCFMETRTRSGTVSEDDGRNQSGTEGRPHLPETKGRLRRSADQVCALPDAVPGDGEAGRLCDGAPSDSGPGDRATAFSERDGPSSESQSYGQCSDQPDAVCDERGSQVVRAWSGHKTAVVRIVPFRHVGKVWCLRVPTGAFVAVRGGVAFPTGNSGFPKATRFKDMPELDGWRYGLQALKPALEPICVAQKPMIGTGPENWRRFGCGGLNIEATKVPGAAPVMERYDAENESLAMSGGSRGGSRKIGFSDAGRWPANLVLSTQEDEYLLKQDVTAEQKQELYRCLHENP